MRGEWYSLVSTPLWLSQLAFSFYPFTVNSTIILELLKIVSGTNKNIEKIPVLALVVEHNVELLTVMKHTPCSKLYSLQFYDLSICSLKGVKRLKTLTYSVMSSKLWNTTRFFSWSVEGLRIRMYLLYVFSPFFSLNTVHQVARHPIGMGSSYYSHKQLVLRLLIKKKKTDSYN